LPDPLEQDGFWADYLLSEADSLGAAVELINAEWVGYPHPAPFTATEVMVLVRRTGRLDRQPVEWGPLGPIGWVSWAHNDWVPFGPYRALWTARPDCQCDLCAQVATLRAAGRDLDAAWLEADWDASIRQCEQIRSRAVWPHLVEAENRHEQMIADFPGYRERHEAFENRTWGLNAPDPFE